MHRLIVNPNTPQAWEIHLKPGDNRLGRTEENDFQISDPSVSGAHCCITVHGDSAIVRDLGSTNGTRVNLAPVQEAGLQNGQSLHLGGVELLFCTETPAPAAAPAVPSVRPAALRVTSSAPAHAPAVHAVPVYAAPAVPAVPVQTGPRFCKSHSKVRARFVCNQCGRAYCDACVVPQTVGAETYKNCRTCGVPCVPLAAETVSASEQSFFRSLPGAFVYPFRGNGILVLLAATLLFAALSFMGGGLIGIFMKAAALGYLFIYLQNIIHSTAAEEDKMPEMPAMDGVFGACFSLIGTVLMSFGPAIGLLIAKIGFDLDVIPMSAVIAALVFGCFYFPMAFLAAAMKDTALAANPVVVLPAILKVPVEYFVTAILMAAVFGVQKAGDLVMTAAGVNGVSFFSTSSFSVMLLTFALGACWSLISMYLLTVNMRILGLLYVTKKEKLAWF